MPFFHASGSEFDEIFVGTGAKRVRQLFGEFCLYIYIWLKYFEVSVSREVSGLPISIQKKKKKKKSICVG